MYLNSVTIIGNLTKDPEKKALPNGSFVTNFSVATNRVWYDANKQKQEAVEYHNVVAFGHLSNSIASYMKKGSQIMIEGRLQTQSWEDKDTQKKMSRTEIVAEKVQFGNKSSGAAPGQSSQATVGTQINLDPQVKDENQPEGFGVFDGIDYPDEDINPEDIPF